MALIIQGFFMVNFNGNIVAVDTHFLNHENRGLRYGDSLFETIKVVQDRINFWEDHYFRLMASMRILRMEIPMRFTMEFLEAEILRTIQINSKESSEHKAFRVRITVFRNNGGYYSPTDNEISFIIETKCLQSPFFMLENVPYEVELFKDFYVNPDMLSTLKTNNKMINVLGSIYAKENNYDNCLLLNQSKHVVEALNGNLFLVKGNYIVTPSLQDGCLNGIIRKNLIEIIQRLDTHTLKEESISPFDLQKADELFITNAILGIRPITKYRKKNFETKIAASLIGKLNAAARLQLS